MLCEGEYSGRSRDLAQAWPSCHVWAATTGKTWSWVQCAFSSKQQPDSCKEATLHILKLAIRGHSWLWGKQLGSHLSCWKENTVIVLFSGNWHHCQATSELLKMYIFMLAFPEFLHVVTIIVQPIKMIKRMHREIKDSVFRLAVE